jgi:aspartyl-tRNA(Asn)/glutamyl-tRNA(Gln) amidotransferase subunit B
VRYEIQRQAAILASGKKVVQETRHYHEEDGTTSAGRVKSDSEDYRYFPEPDLVPLAPSREWVEELRASLPELPAAHRKRIKEEWGLSAEELRDLINADAIDLVEATVAAGATPQGARKWWMGDISRFAKDNAQALEDVPVSPSDVAELDLLVQKGSLNDKLARQALEGMLAGEGSAAEVVAARGLEVVSDDGALVAAVDEALAANPDVVEKIRSGKVKAAGAIVGAVMKATHGKADAARVREIVMERCQ